MTQITLIKKVFYFTTKLHQVTFSLSSNCFIFDAISSVLLGPAELPGNLRRFASVRVPLVLTARTDKQYHQTWQFTATWTSQSAIYTVSQKKVPTFKISVTLSNLNRYSKVLAAGNRTKCATELFDITHLTLSMLLYYIGKLQFQIFCRYLADMKENANKLHFKCTNFNSSMHVTVYAECIYVFLSESCPRCWVPCWLLTNTAVTSSMTNFGATDRQK